MDIIIGVRMMFNFFACSGEQKDEMQKIGISTMVIVCFSFLMITWQWMRIEKEKLKTLPILLLQLWPQYRCLRVIYFGCFKKDPRWREEMAVNEKDVMTLEPMLESGPQLLILIAAWYRIGGTSCQFAYKPDGKMKVDWGRVIFISSWLSSLHTLRHPIGDGPGNPN